MMEENMEDNIKAADTNKELESPKPMAFTIDFGAGKTVDMQRHKTMLERYQKKHRRGQSLSKIEDLATSKNTTPAPVTKKPPNAVLPRKSLQLQQSANPPSEPDPQSTEEKSDRTKHMRALNVKPRDGLSLPLKNVNSDRMTQSCTLPCMDSPDIEVTEVSTPELEALRPPSPLRAESQLTPDSDRLFVEDPHHQWVSGADFDFDKSDAVSDAGTYTLDADAYSEEQKARMSIDREFKIESVSNIKKARDYVQGLAMTNNQLFEDMDMASPTVQQQPLPVHPLNCYLQNNKLSPIVSPTQNFSINSDITGASNHVEYSKTFNKIMFPSPRAKTGIGSGKVVDHGCVISVTSSGAFRSRADKTHARKLSLTKSEIHVEAYTGDTHIATEIQRPTRNLSANLVHVSERLPDDHTNVVYQTGDDDDDENYMHTMQSGKVMNLPPALGGPASGKLSPSKIPSPIHSAAYQHRPRSRNSSNSLNIDLSDSSMETESYLKPTEKLLNSLQQRLSLDSDHDPDSDHDTGGRYLNNDARSNLLKKPTHLRHNSLDEKNLKISNKLEHFQNKKFIDQTNVLNQYKVVPVVQHKIQNSPNNSPIRRSTSFSAKNQMNINAKALNVPQKESNIKSNSPAFARNGSIQRSSSTAAIRGHVRLPGGDSDHNIDRSQYGDTESSSEEDLLQNNLKKKDITATRYNRAFSLRRARLDEPSPPPPPKCPNTPEMRRKFHQERAISVDRRPMVKTPEVQSRYLQNHSKGGGREVRAQTQPPANRPIDAPRGSPKMGNMATKPAPKAPIFSRTDTGRFSMRTNGGGGGGGVGGGKPPITNSQKTIRREINAHKKASGPRSNSSLTSKEVEFQNWKRRKSYDPMKAAAEGKRKAEMARKQHVNPMTQSYHEANQDGDSSPSHSSSVHRSQSFHGTAALEQYISSEDEDEDLTLSADEGFSPPTPSPRDMSPNRTERAPQQQQHLRFLWKDPQFN